MKKQIVKRRIYLGDKVLLEGGLIENHVKDWGIYVTVEEGNFVFKEVYK